MSALEILGVAAALGAAAAFLFRRARKYFSRSSAGCCGRCPVAGADTKP